MFTSSCKVIGVSSKTSSKPNIFYYHVKPVKTDFECSELWKIFSKTFSKFTKILKIFQKITVGFWSDQHKHIKRVITSQLI